jgi:diacylglycerol kinase family enzyme
MRHLFIINPAANRVKGRVDTITRDIIEFFEEYPALKYDLYVTQWSRDAVTYIRHYIEAGDESTVRVHTIGGTGTQFEAVNAVSGLNAEIAAHPYGKSNCFLRYFGKKNVRLFASLKNQVFAKTAEFDVIRFGENDYSICYAQSGVESVGSVLSGNLGQWYSLNIDGKTVSGDYAAIFVANAPCCGNKMYPAVDAHPDDGHFDVYLLKKLSKLNALRLIPLYSFGRHHRLPPGAVTRVTAKKVQITSNEVMCINTDGELRYRTTAEFSLIPKAVRFVIPDEISLGELPQTYNRPKFGLRGGEVSHEPS